MTPLNYMGKIAPPLRGGQLRLRFAHDDVRLRLKTNKVEE